MCNVFLIAGMLIEYFRRTICFCFLRLFNAILSCRYFLSVIKRNEQCFM